MLRDVRSSDVVLAIFLVATTAMLLVPLPTLLLDFLLVINLALAVLLLLAGLYMPNILALLSFPSVLLLLTLFRLGLNVASARLILSQGFAGQVIQSFGSFLIRGEVVVGIIIFLIITIVNFIVVARGASRVSEVAARFALDALPGKQLAIDSDLRSGLISAEQAQRKRDDLRKESQLYGSMDGAMKFIQGDAIAGLIIIAVNIVGGIYLGVKSGLTFSQAVDTYTTLTVGDGLVNQIPAILVSICAGIVVTRVATDNQASLGAELHAQIFRRPGSLLAVGILLVAIALVPGLPFIPFAIVGGLLIAAGIAQKWHLRLAPDAVGLAGDGVDKRGIGHTGSDDELENNALLLRLSSGLLFEYYRSSLEQFRAWWSDLQGDLYSDLGLRVPALRVLVDGGLASGSYSVSVSGSAVLTGKITPDWMLAESNPDFSAVVGLPVVAEAEHPLTGQRVYWTVNSTAMRRIASVGGIRLLTPLQFVGLQIADFFAKHPEETLTVSSVIALESALEKKSPGLINQTLNREFFTTPRLCEIMQQLVREGVSVRDFRQVIEAVAGYASGVGSSLVQEGEFDLHDVVNYVRVQRRRHVAARVTGQRDSIKMISLSDDLQALLEESPPPSLSGQLGLSASVARRVRAGLASVLTPIMRTGVLPVAILCSSDLKSKVVSLLASFPWAPRVVTLEELEPGQKTELLGIWGVALG